MARQRKLRTGVVGLGMGRAQAEGCRKQPERCIVPTLSAREKVVKRTREKRAPLATAEEGIKG
jgi:hypothetical protein